MYDCPYLCIVVCRMSVVVDYKSVSLYVVVLSVSLYGCQILLNVCIFVCLFDSILCLYLCCILV